MRRSYRNPVVSNSSGPVVSEETGLPDHDGEPVLVDQPDVEPVVPLVDRFASRRWFPIIPVWLRSWSNSRAALGYLARFYAHVVGYHAVRLPVYVLRLWLRAPAGVWRLLRVGRGGCWMPRATGCGGRWPATRTLTAI